MCSIFHLFQNSKKKRKIIRKQSEWSPCCSMWSRSPSFPTFIAYNMSTCICLTLFIFIYRCQIRGRLSSKIWFRWTLAPILPPTPKSTMANLTMTSLYKFHHPPAERILEILSKVFIWLHVFAAAHSVLTRALKFITWSTETSLIWILTYPRKLPRSYAQHNGGWTIQRYV